MNGIEMQWATPAVQAVAWALVHFLWQGALAGLVAAALLRALRGARAATRYGVAVALLVLLALLPAATALRFASWASPASVFTQAVSAPAPALPRLADLAVPASDPLLERGAAAVLPGLARLVAPALPFLFGAWLLGVLLLGLAHLGGGWRIGRLVRQAQPLGGEMEARLRRLARRLGASRTVRLLESAAVPVPVVVGWMRPAILVPASTLAGLSPWQLDAILAHELAHVRRHDYLVNLFQAVVETLLFYHPVVWWLSNEIRRERENCCDDLAVEVCGDRLSYARALADLEGLRAAPPGLALAADGGSLLERVRRLVGVPVRRSRRSWLVGLLALALVPAGLALRWAWAESNEARIRAAWDSDYPDYPDDPAERRQAAKDDTPAGRRQGTWEAERKGDKVELDSRLSWRAGGGRHRWQSAETYPLSELHGLSAGPEVRFELRRDAGRFLYQGRFNGDRGKGTFTFEADPTYLRDMAALGYKIDEWRAIEMAIHDVSRSFVREIRSLGYSDSTLDSLVSFRIHDVDPGLVRELSALGLNSVPADALVQLQIHRVSPDFIRGLAAAGYRNLEPDALIQFRIHGVSVEQVRGLEEAGLRSVAPDDLVQLQIHGVSATTVRGLVDAGLKVPKVDDLVQLQIHGISPEYLRSLTQAGLKGLSPEDLVQLRIHGVEEHFVREAIAAHGPLGAADVIELKIRGRLD